MATTTKTGYCNGSDMLLYIGGKAVGHCTSHKSTFTSETNDRAVKPAAWKSGKSIDVKCMEREKDTEPYLAGKCVIASLDRDDPAQDDSSYSVQLENDGEPETLNEDAITETPEAEAPEA